MKETLHWAGILGKTSYTGTPQDKFKKIFDAVIFC